MKKLFVCALCVAAIGSINAQKANVEQAKKLSGKPDKIEEARTLIKQAMQNPETSHDALTYFTAGNVEWDSFDKSKAILAINPNDDKVDRVAMAEELIAGYPYFLAAIPLDQQPNEKGQIKPKYTNKIIGKLADHHSDFFNAGAQMFEAKKFYPQAYQSFMIYADMPSSEIMGKKAPQLPDSVRATSYFNAGLCGWSGSALPEAAVAFKKARECGYGEPECYIYEIACWQNIAAKDSTMTDAAKNAILDVAKAGYEKYGISQPLFINNMVNYMVNDNQLEESITLLNKLIGENPQSAALYALRAFVNDRKGDNAASINDYNLATQMPDADYETYKKAAYKLLRVGTDAMNAADLTNKEVANEIRASYFDKAKELCDRAAQLQAPDNELQYIIENIDYALQNYFK